MRGPLIHDLLDDRVRLVRLEAVRALAPNRPQLTGPTAEQFDRALAEYEAAQALNVDQPQAHTNLAGMYAELGRLDDAERAYKAAIEVGPYFLPAYVNLADLYRTRGRDSEAEATLRKGLEGGDNGGLYHSLGLTLVRLGRTQEALAALRRAHELEPNVPRNAYVYGVALNSLGQREEALKVLEKAHEAHPADSDITVALATMQRDAGNAAVALKYARENAAEWPDSQAAQRLVEVLTATP
jgi:tetratricopeptide (TPR) repeat protein